MQRKVRSELRKDRAGGDEGAAEQIDRDLIIGSEGAPPAIADDLDYPLLRIDGPECAATVCQGNDSLRADFSGGIRGRQHLDNEFGSTLENSCRMRRPLSDDPLPLRRHRRP